MTSLVSRRLNPGFYEGILRVARDPVEDSSPLFTYSPPGAWVDTPLEFQDSPAQVRYASIPWWLNNWQLNFSHTMLPTSKAQQSNLTSLELESTSSLPPSLPPVPTKFISMERDVQRW